MSKQTEVAVQDDDQKLVDRNCEESVMGTPVVTEDEAARLLMQIPNWRMGFHEETKKLMRQFNFVEFKDAFAFTHKLAMLAERENHHPTIITEWGQVTVHWWSRKINGLHLNDFIMAAKTDALQQTDTIVE